MKSILSRWFVFILLAGAFQISSSAQVIGAEANDGEILTRGPVHEAFAGVVNFRPEAGLVVNHAPPDPIEELPPDERPVDADTAWIPGYWGWDDERSDFIWISGTWRVLPPGRAWIPGYWNDTGRGWQWVSGYWEDASRREVVYLAPPPETLERGPSTPSPSADYEWVPGCWEWRDDRYLWRPGYWIEGQTEWVWIPSSYVWTPRGYVFVEGYWDYAPAERGLLFAPVYYREHRRSRYEYRPSIVLNVAILADYLFLRPRYCHYYFGDYYDARYESSGIYATFAFQSSRRGYDPFYSYNRWQHRDDRDWDRQYRASYDYRRRNQDARPPRTWSGSTLTVNVNLNQTTQIGGSARRAETVTYAQPIQQYARSNDAGVRVERAAPTTSQQQVQVARQIQEQRTQRRTMESQGGAAAARVQSGPASRQAAASQTSGATEKSAVSSPAVARVALPTSPIVAREGAGGRQPPPRAQANRRDDGRPARQPERSGRGNDIPRDATPRPGVIGQQPAGQRDVIGGTSAPAPRDESARPERRDSSAENATAVDVRRQEQQARQQEQRQAEEAAQRNVPPSQGQIGLQRDLPPTANERAVQARQRAEERRAIGTTEPAADRARDDQQRREQERRVQQRAEQQQTQQQQADARYQQAESQRQAREQQGRAAEQAREQQSRAAEQERGRRAEAAGQERAQQQQAQAAEQARAAEQERGRQVQAAEQAKAQQQQAQAAERARDQQQAAQAAAQASAQQQQAQAAEQARAQEIQAAAQQARDQQAQAAQQAEAVRQKGPPNRPKAQQPPPQKDPPPKDQSDQSDDDDRKKRKG